MKNGKRASERIELGEYIVADPEVCHGKPTFKGTRIMVWQVLDDVAEGRSWDFICNQRWGGRIPLGAVTEAVRLAQAAWLKPSTRAVHRPATRRSEPAFVWICWTKIFRKTRCRCCRHGVFPAGKLDLTLRGSERRIRTFFHCCISSAQ